MPYERKRALTKTEKFNTAHERTHERPSEYASEHEVALRGRRHAKASANSLQFFATIEGVPEYDGRVRGANGMRWRLA